MEKIQLLLDLFAAYLPELVTDDEGNVLALTLTIPVEGPIKST